jgi:hypothetical protein
MGEADTPSLAENPVEVRVLNKLVETIEDVKVGLDPQVLASWYKVIEAEARSLAPPELKDKIAVYRDKILPMKFKLKASKRVVPTVIEAIENNLNEMPFATRLYFQKVEEILEFEASKPVKEDEEDWSDDDPTLEKL